MNEMWPIFISGQLYLRGQTEDRFPFTRHWMTYNCKTIYNWKGIHNCNPNHKMTIRGNVWGWYWAGTRRNSPWSDFLLSRLLCPFFSFLLLACLRGTASHLRLTQGFFKNPDAPSHPDRGQLDHHLWRWNLASLFSFCCRFTKNWPLEL
jgi:hypothetical protein